MQMRDKSQMDDSHLTAMLNVLSDGEQHRRPEAVGKVYSVRTPDCQHAGFVLKTRRFHRIG
jgi:hypothetical protein